MSAHSAESGSGENYEAFVVRHFGPDPRPKFASPVAPIGVILCFVNRSGSNFLAECLASSCQFPRAREFFLKANLLKTRNSHSDLSDTFGAIVSKHASSGIFATKLGFGQIAFFDSRGFLDAAFARTKFIYLKRQDILDQAISLEFASQSRQWKPGLGESRTADLHYSRKRIELKIRGIQKKYGRFDEFFAKRESPPFRVDYEDLVANPAETVAAAGEFIGCPIRLDPEQIPPAKPPDSLKEAWKRRFLEGN